MLLGAIGVVLALSEPTLPTDALTLQWRAPKGCPGAAEVERRVAVHAAGTSGSHSAVVVTAEVTQREHVFWVQLYLEGVSGVSRHELHSADCTVLVEATAFMAAVAMDPLAKALEPNKAEPSEAQATSPSVRHDDAVGSEVAATGSRVRGFASAQAGMAVGQLAPLGGQVGVSVGLLLPHVRLGADGTFWLPSESPLTVQDAPDAALRLQMWSAGAHACAIARLGPVELPVCGSAEAGLATGRSSGIADPKRSRRRWVAVGLGPGLAWSPVRWFALEAAADLVVALARPAFSIDGLGRVFRAPLASGRVRVGIQVRFP